MLFKNKCNKRKKYSIDVVSRFLLGEWNCEEVEKVIEKAYENIVFQKKNLFMLPTGAVGAVWPLNSWNHGDIEKPIFEVTTIQIHLNHINRPKIIAELWKRFDTMIEKCEWGNVNRVSKLLTNNMSNATLLLDDNTLQFVFMKNIQLQKNEDDKVLYLEENHVCIQ